MGLTVGARAALGVPDADDGAAFVIAVKPVGAALEWNISENALDDREIRAGDNILAVLGPDGYVFVIFSIIENIPGNKSTKAFLSLTKSWFL